MPLSSVLLPDAIFACAVSKRDARSAVGRTLFLSQSLFSCCARCCLLRHGWERPLSFAGGPRMLRGHRQIAGEHRRLLYLSYKVRACHCSLQWNFVQSLFSTASADEAVAGVLAWGAGRFDPCASCTPQQRCRWSWCLMLWWLFVLITFEHIMFLFCLFFRL